MVMVGGSFLESAGKVSVPGQDHRASYRVSRSVPEASAYRVPQVL